MLARKCLSEDDLVFPEITQRVINGSSFLLQVLKKMERDTRWWDCIRLKELDMKYQGTCLLEFVFGECYKLIASLSREDPRVDFSIIYGFIAPDNLSDDELETYYTELTLMWKQMIRDLRS